MVRGVQLIYIIYKLGVADKRKVLRHKKATSQKWLGHQEILLSSAIYELAIEVL